MKALPGVMTIAVVDESKIMAVVGYSNYNGHDCHMMVAGNGAWCRKEYLPVFFKYPFIVGGCKRVTCLCRPSNTRSIRLMKRLGFEYEGTLRNYYDDGDDCHVYGLLRDDCKYIQEGV
jgi:RimJ/RimL family protein N-acetyltransferase